MPYDLNSPMRLAAITLHSLMNQAQEAPEEKRAAAWYIVYRGILIAHKQAILREDVHQRFVAECPKTGKCFEALQFRYRREIADLPAPKPNGSLRKGRAQRKRERAADKQRVAVVAEALQPSA